MYYIKKTLTISAAHRLELDYESKCSNLHGHNWTITVCCRAAQLDKNGMVENIARWICERVEHCYRVEVQESEGNLAVYEKDE